MKKKTKIIIASAISVFVLGLTGLGLWLFLGSGNNGGGGTVTPTPVQYTETNLSRFAAALDELTGGDVEYDGSNLAMSTLAEIKSDYMYNAGLGFQDAQVSSETFYKVIEFLEGLDGEEGYAGFDGTINEGKTIFEALNIDLSEYFDQDTFTENMEGEGGMDDAVNYLMDCVSNLISDMKGSSLTQGSSAGKLRQLFDLFGSETGLTTEEIGRISYYLFDRLLETIENKEASINSILNAKLRESASESDSQLSLIEITATSWVASTITPIRNTLKEVGVEEFSTFIAGLLDSIGSTFDGLTRTNLNTLNQVLNSLTQNIIDAGDDATQVTAAYEGAVNSLTGLASSQAADMRAKRTLLTNGSYTFLNVNSAVNDLIIELENKFIPMVVLFGGEDLSDLSILFAGNSALDLMQTIVDSVGNGILNFLDLLSNDDFAHQFIEVLVDRAEGLDDRTFSLSTMAGVNGAISEINDQLEDLGYETNELVYVSYAGEEGNSEEENDPLNYTYTVSDSLAITEDLKNSIYEGITKIAGFDGLGDYFGIILQNVDEVVIPQSGNDREIALIVKLIAAFVGEEDNQILITRNTDNENNNVYVTLNEDGFTEAIAEGFYRFASEVFKVTMGYIDMNNFVTYDKYPELLEAVVEDQSVYLINYSNDYSLYSQVSSDEMAKLYLSASDYSDLFDFVEHTSGSYTNLFTVINDLRIESSYIERAEDDFIIKQIYLAGRYSSIEGESGSQYVNYDQDVIFLYDSDSKTLVAGLNEADIFAQLAQGLFNNVPEDVFTNAGFETEYTTYQGKTIAELYTIFTAGDSVSIGARTEIISVLNGLFNNSLTQENDIYGFNDLLRYVQVYNNVIAENNDYDRIVLEAVDQSGDHSTTTGERVELKVVNSSTGIVGVELAYEEAKEELEDSFIGISLMLEMVKNAASSVALQEISGTTITVIGEGGTESDFTLESELETSIKNAVRNFLEEYMEDWETAGLNRSDFDTDAAYNEAIATEQQNIIDSAYDGEYSNFNSIISGENGIGQTFSGTILYLFELPQEANDGNARLSQLIGALLKVGIGNMEMFSS